MFIDMHLHSLLSKQNGDSIKMTSYFEAFKKLKNWHVDVASFSDHNIFNAKTYIENKKNARLFGITLFPAVELDVVRLNYKTGNIILIFDNELSGKEVERLEKIINFQTGKRRIKIDKINSLFKDFKKIIVPHVGKADFCSYEDLANIAYDAIEITNYSHKNYLQFRKKLSRDNKKTSIVAWSDTHIWKSYPQNWKLKTQIDKIKTFKDLKKALSLNKDYIKED